MVRLPWICQREARVCTPVHAVMSASVWIVSSLMRKMMFITSQYCWKRWKGWWRMPLTLPHPLGEGERMLPCEAMECLFNFLGHPLPELLCGKLLRMRADVLGVPGHSLEPPHSVEE